MLGGRWCWCESTCVNAALQVAEFPLGEEFPEETAAGAVAAGPRLQGLGLGSSGLGVAGHNTGATAAGAEACDDL